MARDRYQEGWVEEVGKKAKKWKGHYYVYIRRPDGAETRAHRAVTLGKKSELKKWEAEKKLRAIIEKQTNGTAVRPSDEHSFGWFWENRFRPLKEPAWKSSSAPKMVWFIENYVVAP